MPEVKRLTKKKMIDKSSKVGLDPDNENESLYLKFDESVPTLSKFIENPSLLKSDNGTRLISF